MNAPSVSSALFVAVLFISGCKSAPPPAPETAAQPKPAPVTDACQVLTPAEISSALGIPIGPGKGGNVICFWSSAANSASLPSRARKRAKMKTSMVFSFPCAAHVKPPSP